MKKAKRLLAVIMAAVMLFSAACIPSYAYVSSSDNYYVPQQGADGKYYEDFHAISKEGREALNGYILDAYEQKLEEIQADEQGEDESEVIDEDQSAGPSMSQ